jgi:UDP-N-acetylglucosamine 4-epimerase
MSRIIKNSRVLVTGGAGFIGSNLIEALLEQNNQVICLDNFVIGKRSNIAQFEKNKNFILIEGDICDQTACRKACDGVDFVLHQAALGSVPRSVKNPVASIEANVLGTVQVFNAAREAGVKRVVYASSSSVYGDSAELPKIEDKIGKPLSPYAATKYTDEVFAENFSLVYGMEIIGLRYFNVFGRRQDPDGAYAAVVPKFTLALINHESPVINGDGSFSRDFTYIDNVIQANQLAATADNSDAVNKVYNIACGERTDLNKLFYLLRENLSEYDPDIAGIEVVYGAERVGDIPHSHADISRARMWLGYEPVINVRQGIKLTAEWYRRGLK